MNKNVAVFGVFDLFHDGHRAFLKQAKALGSHLTVIIAKDSAVITLKRRKPEHSLFERIESVKKENIADSILPGDENSSDWTALKNIDPDIIALGYDQNDLEGALKKIQRTLPFHFEIIKLSPHKPDVFHTKFLRKEKPRDTM